MNDPNDPRLRAWLRKVFGPLESRKRIASLARKIEREKLCEKRNSTVSIRNRIETAPSEAVVNSLLRNRHTFTQATDDTIRKWERAASKRIGELRGQKL